MTGHPDRAVAHPALVGAVAAAAALTGAASGALVSARGGLAPEIGGGLVALAAVLGVVGLTSASPRVIARLTAVAGLAVAVRFGVTVGRPGVDLLALGGLVVGLIALLVLAHHLPAPGGPSAPPGPRSTLGAGPLAARIVGLSGVAMAAVLLLASGLAARTAGGGGATSGRFTEVDRNGAAPLQSATTLDTTVRPRLSDRVVMRVRTDRDTFWRVDTFDRWDGRVWTRDAVPPLPIVDGQVVARPDDLGAAGPDRIEQVITLEVPFATALPVAPSATSVQAAVGLVQDSDGTVEAVGALGVGATYTVESRREPLSEDLLRSLDGAAPDDIADRWGTTLPASERVVDAAREVTSGATNDYDRIVALERWMGERTRYALDAPLAPVGVDVVDHFLFTSREGWCEQIASSLVVMARSLGIPARLVTGYVPGPREPLSDEVVVREREAHAWAEVWFPEVGWVPFDPTADVPLAGQDQVRTWLDRVRDHGLAIGVGAAVLALVVVATFLVLRARRARAGGPQTVAGIVERDLERLGERTGRRRAPGESASAFAAALAQDLGVPALAGVGEAVDDDLYRPGATTDWTAARSTLSEARAAIRERGRDRTPARAP